MQSCERAKKKRTNKRTNIVSAEFGEVAVNQAFNRLLHQGFFFVRLSNQIKTKRKATKKSANGSVQNSDPRR